MPKHRTANLNLRNLEIVETNNRNSQGYLELRKAPQQDAHSVPSLWYVFTPPSKLVDNSLPGPEIAKFFLQPVMELNDDGYPRGLDCRLL